jgi:hypothetical protein
VRQATKPYGAPVDAGAARQASGGTLDWVVSGLSSSATYFLAVSAYTASRVESPLSNELAIGSPDPCVQDTCTAPTQCTVHALPDGSACGPPGAAGCGSTCLAGTCVGLAEHGFSLDRLKLKLSDQMKVQINAHFATSTLFTPQTSGLERWPTATTARSSTRRWAPPTSWRRRQHLEAGSPPRATAPVRVQVASSSRASAMARPS